MWLFAITSAIIALKETIKRGSFSEKALACVQVSKKMLKTNTRLSSVLSPKLKSAFLGSNDSNRSFSAPHSRITFFLGLDSIFLSFDSKKYKNHTINFKTTKQRVSLFFFIVLKVVFVSLSHLFRKRK